LYSDIIVLHGFDISMFVSFHQFQIHHAANLKCLIPMRILQIHTLEIAKQIAALVLMTFFKSCVTRME
jgi:hypothetical protein